MALIFNGEELPCLAHVTDWRSSGLEFTPNNRGCGRRRTQPALMIVHFTGAENPPPKMFTDMLNGPKPRSVEFGMDYYGHVWQFCDPAKVYCAQAQRANVFSFGIEIQNAGVPQGHTLWKTFPRGTYLEQMPWGMQSYLSFTSNQLTALEQLIDALADAKVIPRKLAMAKSNIRKRIPKAEWKNLKGVAGHYHCDTEPGKIDPGPQVFDELWEHFNG
jgi:N-acetyl-anhydromuramyl-L-alanine amidase AmpD